MAEVAAPVADEHWAASHGALPADVRPTKIFIGGISRRTTTKHLRERRRSTTMSAQGVGERGQLSNRTEPHAQMECVRIRQQLHEHLRKQGHIHTLCMITLCNQLMFAWKFVLSCDAGTSIICFVDGEVVQGLMVCCEGVSTCSNGQRIDFLGACPPGAAVCLQIQCSLVIVQCA